MWHVSHEAVPRPPDKFLYGYDLKRNENNLFRSSDRCNNFPYVAEVYGMSNTNQYIFQCLTTLIAFSWTITAASCYNISYSSYWIMAGTLPKCHDFAWNGQKRKVLKWVFYTKRETNKPDNYFNIALINTETEFKITPAVNFIRLFPFSELQTCDLTVKYKSCSLISYDDDDNLKMINVTIIKFWQCKESPVGHAVPLNFTHTCSSSKELVKRNRNDCFGEIGSPLVCGKQQAAILVGTFGCETTHRALYVRVDQFQNWIKQHVKKGLWYIENKYPVCCYNTTVLILNRKNCCLKIATVNFRCLLIISTFLHFLT